MKTFWIFVVVSALALAVFAANNADETVAPALVKSISPEMRAQYWRAKGEFDVASLKLQSVVKDMAAYCGEGNLLQNDPAGEPMCAPRPKPTALPPAH